MGGSYLPAAKIGQFPPHILSHLLFVQFLKKYHYIFIILITHNCYAYSGLRFVTEVNSCHLKISEHKCTSIELKV